MEDLNYNSDNLKKYLIKNGLNFTENLELSNLSFIKAGGISRFFIEPNKKDQLVNLITFLKNENIPFLVIGNLSNTLFRDGFINTIIISTKSLNNTFYFDNRIEAEAGVLLPQLAYKLTKSGFNGFSGLTGFPATIGGAIFMNASCYNSCISDKLLYVEILNENGLIEKWNKEKFHFNWRYSILHDLNQNIIILSATFSLEKGNVDDLTSSLNKIRINRLNYQENSNPNLGSIFATKNIYHEICKKNFIYSIIYYGFLLYSKLFLKKHPIKHAHYLNKITQKYFNLSNNKIKFSYFTFNCIINKNNNKANDIISFIKTIHKKIRFCVKIEIIIYETIF